MKKKTSSPKTAESGKLKKALSCWQLYILLIPALIWLIVFAYYPMYGLIIAFKDFKGRMGIMGSPWADPIFKYFKMFFSTSIAMTAIKNTIIIMTSNMGSQVIQENFAEAFDGKRLSPEVIERTRREVIDLLKQQLKPEFLNRIDEIVMFEPLTRKDIERIVDIQMGGVRRMLAENGIRLEYSDKAREWIANAGFDPLYGARPVKRTIQRYVINDLSKRILAGEVDRSKPISIDAGADGLVFTN